VHDNPALLYFLEHIERSNSTADALFFICKEQWRRHHFSDIKIDLMLRHVNLLSKQLFKFGVTLQVVNCDNFNEQIDYLKKQTQLNNYEAIVVNQELEFREQQRDKKIVAQGLNLISFEADVIVPKGKVLNQQHEMYKVFTPFKNAWLRYVNESSFNYISKQELQRFEKADVDLTDTENALQSITTDNCSNAWPLVDEVEASIIPDFLNEKLAHYAQQRDIPDIKGTSGLSSYLAIGALSPRYLVRLLLQRHPDILHASDSGQFVWLNELIWRDFYRHLLYHFPRLSQEQNFNPKYNAMQWLNS
jgi:deoxyribodipyrimidine photo-lyase